MNCVCEMDVNGKVIGLCGAHTEAFRKFSAPKTYTSDQVLNLPANILAMVLPYKTNEAILASIKILCDTFLERWR